MSLGPGKTWMAPAEQLGRWYGTKERGVYRFGAIYRVGYYDKTAYEDKKGDAHELWEECHGGMFELVVK